MRIIWVRLIFAVAGAYDLIIGVGFFAVGPKIYDAFGVPPPNHWGYLQFASLLVAIFGVMFIAVALQPLANRNLIPYGVLLKLSYVGVVGHHWAELPWLFKPFAGIDALMVVLFLFAYVSLLRLTAQPPAST